MNQILLSEKMDAELDSELNMEVMEMLNRINNELHNSYKLYPTLYSGDAGIALFQLLYNKKFNSITDFSDWEDKIQEIAEKGLSFHSPTFCGGRSGIYWFLFFLSKLGILPVEDLQVIRDEEPKLKSEALHFLRNGNYDFLHGSIGICWYLLSQPDHDLVFFRDFLEILYDLTFTSSTKDAVPNFNFTESRVEYDKINLGLAHGIVSIIKFCLECHKNNIYPDLSRKIAEIHINYLLKHIKTDNSDSYFVCWVSANESNEMASRLAWCYGDLTIGHILWQSSRILEKKELEEFSLKVLRDCCKRRDFSETMVFDAGICHGSSGLAFIFKKIWENTSELLFLETSKFWIKKTISFSCYPDGLAGYKKHNPQAIENPYENETGILDGISGIGLVLLNYMTNESSWDYCFMLNN